ncbi:MAG: pyruvate kinase [Candidatus Omnitrophica bacterium]|nr:pyruvate kinase [Candidatus Omnitrophota bacterium]
MSRYTRIICTLGPASSSEDMIAKMAKRGMNVVRINFSHGNHKQHQKMIDMVRAVNQKYKYEINVLQDLEGYRIRVGHLKKSLSLEKDSIFYMSHEVLNEKDHISFDYMEDIKTIEKGSNVFIDDGNLHLRVVGFDANKRLKLKVIQGGLLKERKGINIPGLKLQSNILTEQDKADIDFGIKNKVEKIAQSFVRNKRDIQRIMDIVKPQLPNCLVIAKIENPDGVANVDSIIDACDGIMVARGDLGVTFPIYKVPVLQKYLIKRATRKKKLVVTATQMLESMIENGRPTRAEVSDVANAILDGTDYVMLSAETAVGKYPSRSIQMMSHIIEYTEKYEEFRP